MFVLMKVKISYASSLNGIELHENCKTTKMIPRGKSYWNSHLEDINWKQTLLLPHTFCIFNKVKEINFKKFKQNLSSTFCNIWLWKAPGKFL